MVRLISALLLVFFTAHGQAPELSPAWVGLWTENPTKSSIFFPGTLSVGADTGGTYYLAGPGGERSPLSCVSPSRPRQPCLYLTEPQPGGRVGKAGVEYRVNAQGTKLQVNRWRVVPDGTRLTDTDYYARSGYGKGFAGSWRKSRSTEAPTVYRISCDGDRFTFKVPNGELTITFSLSEARTPQGASASSHPEYGNRYKLLGPSQILEESLFAGKVTAQSVITLSPDGRTMTEDHTDAGPSPHPLHIVYDHSE